jgi:hypothetical protein
MACNHGNVQNLNVLTSSTFESVGRKVWLAVRHALVALAAQARCPPRNRTAQSIDQVG